MMSTLFKSRNVSTAAVKGAADRKLPMRDWVLLPALSLLTIGVLVISTEWIACRTFSVSTSTTLRCLILNDLSTGVRAIPNTVCSQKTNESELVEYRFNSCGHRAGMDCGPKDSGTYRIVMVGSSFDFGMSVPREKSFAALLPAELSQRTGHKVELYNEAMQWGFPASVALRFPQVMTERPDMVLWVLTPTDVASSSLVVPFVPSQNPIETGGGIARAVNRMKVAFATNSIESAIITLWNHSVANVWNRNLDAFRETPTGIMLQHSLYSSQSLYLRAYLTDPEANFLKANLSPEWQSDLQQFEMDAAEIEREAKSAGIPFVAVLVPNRAQAAMLSMGEWPESFDPNKLDNDLRAIIERHGGTYLEIMPDYRKTPNAEQYYFPVDGHPDADGHAMISRMLAKELTGGAVPALTITAQPQLTMRRGR